MWCTGAAGQKRLGTGTETSRDKNVLVVQLLYRSSSKLLVGNRLLAKAANTAGALSDFHHVLSKFVEDLGLLLLLRFPF